MSDGSSVPRRQLGRLLREAREEAGLSIEGASRSLEWSRAKMYRVESGAAPLRTHDVAAIGTLYSVAPEMHELLFSLAKEGKEGAWWHTYGEALPPWFELYVGMEAYAMRLRQYDAGIIPGLLQTADYAEAVLREIPSFTAEQIAAKIAIRLERQRIFTRRRPAPPKVDILLDESALRRPLQKRDAWCAQLRQVLEMASRPMISIRVLPISTTPHPTLASGSFVILDFYPLGMRTPEPATVYYEGVSGALYLDKPKEVDTYVDRWKLLGRKAMSGEETKHLLATLIKEHE